MLLMTHSYDTAHHKFASRMTYELIHMTKVLAASIVHGCLTLHIVAMSYG